VSLEEQFSNSLATELYSQNIKSVPLPQSIDLFCFSAAVTDLSANTAIKVSFVFVYDNL
jgi:hypothetical protein